MKSRVTSVRLLSCLHLHCHPTEIQRKGVRKGVRIQQEIYSCYIFMCRIEEVRRHNFSSVIFFRSKPDDIVAPPPYGCNALIWVHRLLSCVSFQPHYRTQEMCKAGSKMNFLSSPILYAEIHKSAELLHTHAFQVIRQRVCFIYRQKRRHDHNLEEGINQLLFICYGCITVFTIPVYTQKEILVSPPNIYYRCKQHFQYFYQYYKHYRSKVWNHSQISFIFMQFTNN